MRGVEVGPSIMETEAPNLVGKVLSERYRIERFLDEGGMGAVYLAEHLLMRKRVAVKVLHAEIKRMPEAVERFAHEALAVAQIDHPNVAAATDFGKFDDDSFFLVLEYVEGKNLSSLIAEGPLEVGRALHIAHQIASALARAHSLGIVHRDLKPDNVMLVELDGDPNFVKILDFGIAKLPVVSPAPSTTQPGAIFGTPTYMSPEQAVGRAVDARADLYALGVVLFEMLTGVRPFPGENHHVVSALKLTCDPPSISSADPDVQVSDAVEALVMRLLQRNPDDRFQTADAVLDAIETSGSWAPRKRASTLPRPLPRLSRWSRIRRALPVDILAGAGVALLLFFVAFVFLRSPVLPADQPVEPRPNSSALFENVPAARPGSPKPATIEDLPVVPRTQVAATESARRAPPNSKLRQKRSSELTDFGGRH
jgi:serine/threonine-protein kinase